MKKLITINYLSHNRLNFSTLTFHFLSKIKKENKDKLFLNILATHDTNWAEICEPLEIDYAIHINNSNHNYLPKIGIAISSETEYSVKLDEDCFMNNYVWDYIIENIDVLQNPRILTLSPIMSNNIPSCDYFINDFIKDNQIKDSVYNCFLRRDMPNGLWGVDYTPLNEFTIEAKTWDTQKFYHGVSELPTITKGIHPLRISYEAQMIINDYIVNNIDSFINKNEYEIMEIKAPYFTNSLFFIRTEEWKTILRQSTVDAYDEIALNHYKSINNKEFLFVRNGFGIHPMFNTVYGNKNPWKIGGERGDLDELNFYNNLVKQIIK
jgi:hypothetical protein